MVLTLFHIGEIWSRKPKKYFDFKKISSVFAPVSCGNRSRGGNGPSLLFGNPPTLVSSEKYFHSNDSIRDTQAVSKKRTIKFLNILKNFGFLVDDFKKLLAIGGCGLRKICPL